LIKQVQKGTLTNEALETVSCLDNTQLETLIRRSVATRVLCKYKELSRLHTATTLEEKDRNDAQHEYSAVSKAFGEARNIDTDLWICEQGLAMRKVFEQSSMENARASLLKGQKLDLHEIKNLVQHVFREMAKDYRPAALSIDRNTDLEALTFWVSLLTMAGYDQNGTPCGLGLSEVQGKNYSLTAVTDGVDINLLKKLQKSTGQNVFDKVAGEAKG
jgi:hypothetical protein